MWQIKILWNESLKLTRSERGARDYIYASDIGKPFLDRYYSMIGEPITNPFDTRILRVFEAGNLFEWVVKRVLIRAGLLLDYQKPCLIEPKGLLKVSGRLDFIAGGKPDWDKIQQQIKQEEYLPENLSRLSEQLVFELSKAYPNGLPECIPEVKSVHSLAFWAHLESLKKAYPHHRLQTYSYMKSEGLPGKVLYISKDDLCLEEVDIEYPNKELEDAWMEDVSKMTHYFTKRIVPPREPDIIFSEEKQEWVVNWKVGRSLWLSKITGMTREDWEPYAEKLARKKNKEFKGAEEIAFYRKAYKDEYRKKNKKKGEENGDE
ncbi:MAG TPA: hypothetical protein PKN54_00440 [Candidatus Cloacimonas acidaminovorans]|nr:hypothetical protein [Candidatus Cloacimonas acidaminovorans]